MIPKYAVLDTELTLGLPRNLTAATGMDALTHAVEAYTNKYASKESKKYALEAVRMIFASITKAYDEGNDADIRNQMLLASATSLVTASVRIPGVNSLNCTQI